MKCIIILFFQEHEHIDDGQLGGTWLQLALHQSFMPGVAVQGGMATQEPP